MRKRKIVIAGLVAAFCVSLAAGAHVSLKNASANPVPVWGSVSVEESYEYGSTFSLPERKITLGGKYGKVTTFLRYPSGSETKEATAKLDEAGIYTLRFIAEAGGEVYLDEIKFDVTAKYAITGDKSTAVYNAESVKPGSGAMYVRLAAGETLEFSEPIDLKNATKNDRLIELMAIPDNLGNQDFEKITVRLTDVYDPSIYVDIISYAYGGSDNGYRAWVLSRGNGQTPKGYFHNGSSLILNQNVSGTSTAHYFNGYKGADGKQQYSSLRLAFDYENNAVYANERLNIDLDSPDCFPELLWSGFTGSKVKMSIFCDLYSASTANFEIYSVYGLDISKDLYPDENSPEITVSADESSMPTAEAGRTYGVPSAYAFDDVCGYLDAECRVYYNYNSKNPVSIAVEDGKFATNFTGYYAIVYSAEDFSGNKSEKILWVNCLADAEDPFVTIDESTKKTTAYLGETYEIADATYGGGSGKLETSVYVEKDGVETIVEYGVFTPETEGTYKVIYRVIDEIGQSAQEEYLFEAVASSAPVFFGEAVLPSVMIAGGSYKIPDFKAYDYGGGVKNKVDVLCVVTDKNGEKTYKAGDTFVPEIEGKKSNVSFRFKAGDTEKLYEVPTVDVWNVVGKRKRLDFAAYMYSEDGVVTEKTENGLKVTVGGNGTAEFINPLLADRFALTLRGTAGGFGKAYVTLTDNEDVSVAVTLILEEKNGKAYLTADRTTVSPDFAFDGNKNIEITYSDGKITVGGLSVAIGKTDSGKPFEGFKSHKVRTSFAFETEGEKSLYIEKVVNHSFIGTVTSDSTEPAYYVSGAAGGTFIPGKVTIPAAYAADVLDPNVLFTMSVIDSEGNFLKDENGVIMKDVDPARDYAVLLDKIGDYAVKYTVSDIFNSTPNPTGYSVSYTVCDNEAPVFKFFGEFKTSINVGDVYVLPRFTVSDNYSASDKIFVSVYVTTPSGRMFEIHSGSNSFKADAAGKYTLHLMATDEAGNVDYFTVNVTAE